SLDSQLHLGCGDHAEHSTCTLLKFVGSNDVVPQRWPGQKKRSLLRQENRINRRDRPARPPKQCHHAAGSQHVKTLVKGGLAYRIVNNINTLPAAQTLALALEVAFRI